MFSNRHEAALQLTKLLLKYKGTNPLVLGIPRGGVQMAKTIADGLNGQLDVVLVRKIGAPGNPEYALGAVDEFGHVVMNPEASFLGVPQSFIDDVVSDELSVLKARREAYTPNRGAIDLAGRVVIIVDDGIATGSTMAAAIMSARAKDPLEIVVAVGVAPRDTVARLSTMADDVVAVATPEPFWAVGRFFDDFRAVSDDEVVDALDAGD